MAGTDDKAMTSPTFCKNGCGFYGSPNTEGLCSKCFRDLKKDNTSNTTIPTGTSCRNENTAMGTSVMISSMNQGNGASSIDVSSLEVDETGVQPIEVDEHSAQGTITNSSSSPHSCTTTNSSTNTNPIAAAASQNRLLHHPSSSYNSDYATSGGSMTNSGGMSTGTAAASASSNDDARLMAGPVVNPALLQSEATGDGTGGTASSCPSGGLWSSSGNLSAPSSLSTSAAAASVTSLSLPPTSDSDNTTRTQKNRCNVCNKKLGLTGFSCRCGGLFCSIHRYSDGHECDFDYKTEAKNALRKANPKVDGEKIKKI